MKKITALMFGVIVIVSLAGCSGARFMSDNEIKTLSQNPTGEIKLEIVSDGEEKLVTLTYELYYSDAPITVTNFVSLVKSGFYDSTYSTEYSADDSVKAYIDVLGAYKEDDDSVNYSSKTLDYTIKGEFKDNGWTKNTVLHEAWTLSMLTDTTGKDTASHWFTLLLEKNEEMDGSYAAFGRTSRSNELLYMLRDTNVTSIKIISITVDTHGVDLGKPLTIKK